MTNQGGGGGGESRVEELEGGRATNPTAEVLGSSSWFQHALNPKP